MTVGCKFLILCLVVMVASCHCRLPHYFVPAECFTVTFLKMSRILTTQVCKLNSQYQLLFFYSVFKNTHGFMINIWCAVLWSPNCIIFIEITCSETQRMASISEFNLMIIRIFQPFVEPNSCFFFIERWRVLHVVILCVLPLRFIIYLSVRQEKSSEGRQEAEECKLSGTWFLVLQSKVFFKGPDVSTMFRFSSRPDGLSGSLIALFLFHS